MNSIMTYLKRFNQVVSNCLTTFELEVKVINKQDADPLTIASYTIPYAYHKIYGHSPGELIFGCAMFMPVSISIDWESIKERKQKSNFKEQPKGKLKPNSLSI